MFNQGEGVWVKQVINLDLSVDEQELIDFEVTLIYEIRCTNAKCDKHWFELLKPEHPLQCPRCKKWGLVK